MKRLALLVMFVFLLCMYGCAAQETYNKDDIENAYNKGYKAAVHDAMEEIKWVVDDSTALLLDIADTQVIDGLGPVYGRLYESDASASLKVTESALDNIAEAVRTVIKKLEDMKSGVLSLEP